MKALVTGNQDAMQRYDAKQLLYPLPLFFTCLKHSQLLRSAAEEVGLEKH